MAMTHRSDVHVDRVLSNMVLGYKEGTSIADAILPELPVAKDTGKYYKWGRGEIDITGLDTLKAPRAEPREVDFSASLDTYTMERHGLAVALDDDVKHNADSELRYETIKARKLMSTVNRVYEKALNGVVFTASTYGSDNKVQLSTNDRWNSTHADSNPLADINAAKIVVKKKVGVVPNVLIMGWADMLTLRRHPLIVESVKYVSKTGMSHIEMAEVAAYLGVAKIILGDDIYNTAEPGLTESADFIWKTHALLLYNPKTPMIDEPAFGYKMVPADKKRRSRVERYRKPGQECEWIYASEMRSAKICMPECAYFFEDAFA